MSMEYLMGRSLTNTMINTGVETEFEEAVYEVKYGMCDVKVYNGYYKLCLHEQ